MPVIPLDVLPALAEANLRCRVDCEPTDAALPFCDATAEAPEADGFVDCGRFGRLAPPLGAAPLPIMVFSSPCRK